MRKAIFITLMTFAIFACNKGGNSPTSPTSNSPAFGPHTQLENNTTPTETPETAAPEGESGGVYIKVNNDGSANVNNASNKTFNGRTCAFINGEHPQNFIGMINYSIPAGQRRDVSPPNIEWPEEVCGEVTLQVDSGEITCDDTNSNRLGPGLIAWNWVTVNAGDCECVPGKSVTVSEDDPVWGDWGICEAITNSEETCYECRTGTQTIHLTDGCKEWTEVKEVRDKREVECQCEEGGPYEGDPIFSEEILEGQCDFPNDFACHRDGTRTDTYDCSDPVEVPVCQPTSCPCDPEKIVHRVEVGCEPIDEGLDPNKCWRCFNETNECGDVEIVPEEISCPSLGDCFYRVSCGDQESFTLSGNCEDQQQKLICENQGGEWLNFITGVLHNHCAFSLPGISHNDFQLTPGQSDPECLDKNDVK